MKKSSKKRTLKTVPPTPHETSSDQVDATIEEQHGAKVEKDPRPVILTPVSPPESDGPMGRSNPAARFRSAATSGGGGPVLRFRPDAWAKLVWFCHHGPTEIGGFGISSADDPLLIEDFCTLKQEVSVATVDFDDGAVADFFDEQVDQGRSPEQFARIWLHTHPGSSPLPSATDEQTFERVFGACDWSLMFILAREGRAYARLRCSRGPVVEVLIPVAIDWSAPPSGADMAALLQEYDAHIEVDSLTRQWTSWDEDLLDLDAVDQVEPWLEEVPDIEDLIDQMERRPERI